MAALNTNDFAYVVPPTAQFKDENGVPYSAGFVEFYKHGTSEQYQTYADWAGSLNPFRIQLNSQGRTVAIIPKTALLDMYVYNYIGNLMYTRLNVGAGGGEGGDTLLQFTSDDHSITIVKDGYKVDFSVTQDEKFYGHAVASSTDNNGGIVFNNLVDGNIELSGGKIVLGKGKLYHVTVAMKFATSNLHADLASCIIRDSEQGAHTFVLDESIPENYAEVSWDLTSSSNLLQLALQIPSYFGLEKADLWIHSTNSTTVSGGGGSGSNTIVTSSDGSVDIEATTVDNTTTYDLSVPLDEYAKIEDLPEGVPESSAQDEGKILQVDSEGKPQWAPPQSFTQVQADWNQSDSSAVDYIKNKPTIPAAQVNSDWNAVSGVAQILNKPDMSLYALKSEIPTVPTIGYTEL